jgi:hypothetical protein
MEIPRHCLLHSNEGVDTVRQCKYHLLVMPLTRFLQNTAFGPEEIALLVAAYKAALHELGQAGQSDPVTEIVAKKIIELAKQGERDLNQLRKRAVEALRDAPPDTAAGA